MVDLEGTALYRFLCGRGTREQWDFWCQDIDPGFTSKTLEEVQPKVGCGVMVCIDR